MDWNFNVDVDAIYGFEIMNALRATYKAKKLFFAW